MNAIQTIGELRTVLRHYASQDTIHIELPDTVTNVPIQRIVRQPGAMPPMVAVILYPGDTADPSIGIFQAAIAACDDTDTVAIALPDTPTPVTIQGVAVFGSFGKTAQFCSVGLITAED